MLNYPWDFSLWPLDFLQGLQAKELELGVSNCMRTVHNSWCEVRKLP